MTRTGASQGGHLGRNTHPTSDAEDSPTEGELRADPARIAAGIEQFASISEGSGPGVTRLAYTKLERLAHELFADQMRGLGLRLSVDPAGNTIAELPGRSSEVGAIGTGSHLDSVPHAGSFDGIAGVVASLEAARLLVEQQVGLNRPVRFVAFAGEEGARFGQACLGSRLAAGLVNEWELESRVDAQGISLLQAMASVGFDGRTAASNPWNAQEWAYFIELHVEQGGVLERLECPVGIVDLISGSTRLELRLRGQASHSGATPMSLRRDPLPAAAELILLAEQLGTDHRHRGTRLTVGKVQASPGSMTTISGEVVLSVDIRDTDSDRQRATAAELLRRGRAVCDARNIRLDARLLGDTSPAILPTWLRQRLAEQCKAERIRYRVLTSGASHDAQIMNRITDAAMIFVPSKGGLSHVPAEWTSAADIAVGVDLLVSAIADLDAGLSDKPAAARPDPSGET